MKKDIKKVGINVPMELFEKLENISENTGISKSNIIKMLLTRHLEKDFTRKGENYNA